MIGPGKYDDEATMVRERTKAVAVILIVIGGDRGSSFSVQAPNGIVDRLPAILRQMADEIETDLKTTTETILCVDSEMEDICQVVKRLGRKQYERIKCPSCGHHVTISACGIRMHYSYDLQKQCPASGKTPEIWKMLQAAD